MSRLSLFIAGNTDATSGATVSYSTTTETTFQWSVGMEFGVTYEAEAGVLFVKAKTTLSLKISASVGGSSTDSNTTTSSFAITIPIKAGYTDSYYVTGTKYVANVPYTADVYTTYTDGTSTIGTTSGVVDHLSVNSS